MKQYTITLTDEEDKAMQYIAYSVQDWLDNAAHNRARQAMDEIILQHSDKQPKKIVQEERATIVRNADIKTAAQRQKESEEKQLK